MGIIAWLILGAFSGWIASIIMGKNASMGAIANIVTGIIGAFIGGVVFNFFGAQRVTGFNLHSVLVSVVGACILLWILNKISKK
ncbi:GlsB/YeaQ/YmgE family stress response membrane protein [Fusobacterium periodonticum]|uniref:GlsB/YeaQ/YmgE family stress response membrane protein n=1 Tax=Fusobacterium periodonticum TaxID=860 RepID=UPI0028D8D145|nr:GlsB/YeaQ/YmgE family stress response membrane protein [Fusobacterium periodonticum]